MASCTTTPSGTVCPTSPSVAACALWELSEQSRTSCYVDQLTQEHLNIGGATVNIYRLLGVHTQTELTNSTGMGTAISGGDRVGFSAREAFSTYATEWRSVQQGTSSVIQRAYIGYDFGELRLPNGRIQYAGTETAVRRHITTVRIKQSIDPDKRATKLRLERSDDGSSWYGVSVTVVPDSGDLITLSFKHSVPSRFWRIRPIEFSSGCGWWGVRALELIDFMVTAVGNIQDKILMENRDRQYDLVPVKLKGFYDLLSPTSELARFGIEIPTGNYRITVNFSACVLQLGRPIVIGDIIELPSETQYSPSLQPIRRYLEVTDVTWDSQTYTPGWVPTMLLVSTQPALASQETQSIFGDFVSTIDQSGLFDRADGNSTAYQDLHDITDTIEAESNTLVPQKGSEGSNAIREFTESDLAIADANHAPTIRASGLNSTGLYVEDAIPPNGLPFSEGVALPNTTNASDGEYHRLTYEGAAAAIPARLYRFSAAKNRWIFMEQDKRTAFASQKPLLDEYVMRSPTRFSTDIK